MSEEVEIDVLALVVKTLKEHNEILVGKNNLYLKIIDDMVNEGYITKEDYDSLNYIYKLTEIGEEYLAIQAL